MILVQFGPILVNVFGNAVYTLRGGDKSDNTPPTGKELLQPPILIGIPDATQSARISFSGSSPDTNGVIELYVNDDLQKELTVTDKNGFSVDSLPLSKGVNTIKARFIKKDKTSSFTQDYQVNYITSQPKLDISFPVDNATYTKADKNITVAGTTDSENTVSVNSFRAIVDVDGKFTYLLQLNDGDNQIIIEAKNPAGATTQKSLKVTYHNN